MASSPKTTNRIMSGEDSHSIKNTVTLIAAKVAAIVKKATPLYS